MRLRSRIIYVLLLAVAIVIVMSIMWLGFGGWIETAEVVLPTAPVSGDGSEESPGGNWVHSTVEITPGTVQAVIETLERPDSYSRVLTVSRYWSGGGSEENIEVFVKDDSTKAIIRRDDEEKHVLIIGGDLWIWQPGYPGVFSGKASENDSDEFQSIPTYEDILLLPSGSISDAGYEEYDQQQCIFVEYSSGTLSYLTRVYIPIETGLVSGCERYDGGELVYSVTSTPVTLITPDDEVFALPEA